MVTLLAIFVLLLVKCITYYLIFMLYLSSIIFFCLLYYYKIMNLNKTFLYPTQVTFFLCLLYTLSIPLALAHSCLINIANVSIKPGTPALTTVISAKHQYLLLSQLCCSFIYLFFPTC